jgi:hypothetical protein
MRTHIVVVWLLLSLFLAPFALANTEVLTGQDASNRFLSAEVTRQMQASQKAIIEEVKNHNDQNFQIFDARMNSMMTDIRTKSILGVIGAALIASGISTLVILRIVRNYSYEKYQEGLLAKYAEQEDSRLRDRGLEQMQQSSWETQQQANNITAQIGVAAVANQSQMNSWQGTPSHDGAWRSPDIQPEYVQFNVPPQPQYTTDFNPDDPLDSPGWNMRGI